MAAVETGAQGPCQIYLMIEAGAGALERLTAVLAAHPLVSVLIQPVAGQALTAANVKPLVDFGQKRNVAMLLVDDAALARTLRADGVHLKAGADIVERYREARSIVGGGAIVGVEASGSRHVAMELGEAGADYVAFGDVPGIANEDDVEGPVTQDELLAWWAEVFEIPCVALDVPDPDLAADFASLGCDFVAVRVPSGQAVAAIVAYVAAMRSAVETGHDDQGRA